MKRKMKSVWAAALSILVLLLGIGRAPGQEVGVDRPGKDLKPGFDLPRADYLLCEKACNDEPNCKAYTYVKPNTVQGPNPRCWLKSEMPAAVKNDCCLSGIKRTALYRFWNGKDHFYTTHCKGEAVPPARCDSAYSFEKIAGYIAIGQMENTTSLYRMLNKATGDHFYTTSPGEKKAAEPNYQDEGIEGYLATTWFPGTTVMYRMFNPLSGDHFYTTDLNERNIAKLNGWRDEGTIGQVWQSGSNPCQPAPDFEPRILSFTQTVVSDDQARLYWSVKSGPCCNIKIVGYADFANLNSTGSQLVWRERNPYAQGDTEYKLIVQCRKNQDSQIVKVPIWTGGGEKITTKTYFFKAVQSSSVTPCFVFSVTAPGENEAMQSAQAYAANATVTEITEAQFYDPKTCGQ